MDLGIKSTDSSEGTKRPSARGFSRSNHASHANASGSSRFPSFPLLPFAPSSGRLPIGSPPPRRRPPHPSGSHIVPTGALRFHMEELAHSASAAVYAPGGSAVRSLQVWRTVVSWAGFLFQLLLQILRGTLSWVQLLSFVPFLSSSAASSPAFRPLPVEPPAITRPPPPLPPTVSDGPSDKLTVVLDLDETLVCAYESSSLPSLVHNRAIEAGLKCFELECMSAEKDTEQKQKVNHVTVFERPGLREFLQQCSQFANLVLFTAGLEGYASPLVDRIDVDNNFTLRLYRSSTVSTEYREHVKDLSCVSKDLSRVIIVDNNPFSFLLQPRNGIPCIPFSAGQPCDQQLMGVLLPLLKHLSLQEDVRPILHEKFHMPEWFRQHGIPTVGCTL